jgi:hypothetical protein
LTESFIQRRLDGDAADDDDVADDIDDDSNGNGGGDAYDDDENDESIEREFKQLQLQHCFLSKYGIRLR